MATRMPMITMTMRSSMIVKPRETVEVLEELRELKALEMVETLFACWYLVSLLSLFIMEYYFILCLELLQISTYVLMYLCTYVLM